MERTGYSLLHRLAAELIEFVLLVQAVVVELWGGEGYGGCVCVPGIGVEGEEREEEEDGGGWEEGGMHGVVIYRWIGMVVLFGRGFNRGSRGGRGRDVARK